MRQSSVAELSHQGYQSRHFGEASKILNTTETDVAKEAAATAELVQDALPASKGQLQQTNYHVDRDDVLIQQLIDKVNSLTPVPLLRHPMLFVKSCAAKTHDAAKRC